MFFQKYYSDFEFYFFSRSRQYCDNFNFSLLQRNNILTDFVIKIVHIVYIRNITNIERERKRERESAVLAGPIFKCDGSTFLNDALK